MRTVCAVIHVCMCVSICVYIYRYILISLSLCSVMMTPNVCVRTCMSTSKTRVQKHALIHISYTCSSTCSYLVHVHLRTHRKYMYICHSLIPTGSCLPNKHKCVFLHANSKECKVTLVSALPCVSATPLPGQRAACPPHCSRFT